MFIDEFGVFLMHLLDAKSVSRKDFDEFCPRTKGDGPCGFAVIIGILEHFKVVEVLDGEYRITSSENILQLLGKK